MYPLNRSQYLYLSDTGVEVFKSLKRRDQVPLLAAFRDNNSDDTEALFSPLEAIMLSLANNLTRFGGLDRSFSTDIIRRFPENVVEAVKRIEENQEDIWIGVFQWSEGASEHYNPLIGTMDELNFILKEAKKGDGYFSYQSVYRITFVSVSGVFNRVMNKARNRGIFFGNTILVK